MASKPMPLAIMIPLDVMLIAGSLLTFAYFHHVRPKVLVEDPSTLPQAVIPNQSSMDSYIVPMDVTTTAHSTTSSVEEKTTGETSETTGAASNTTDATGTETTESGATNNGTGETPVSGTPNQTTEPTKTSKTTTTTTTTAVQYDMSGWGAKWPTMFSLGNEIEQTDYTYRSHDIYIQINPITWADSNCYVADIYVRNIENFSFAFAKDVFATGTAENVISMTQRHGALLAINGDYYGVRDNGVVIRNYTLYRDTPRSDVAALYYDGRVETYTKDEFDVSTAMASGIKDTFAFGPNLVRSGIIQSGWTANVYTEKHPRSGFGYYEPGHYCFVAADGRGMGGSVGLTMEEFANMFGQLGCVEAYNLDGGKSSQLIFNNRVINQPDGFNGDNSSLRGLTDIYLIKEVN